MPPTEMSMPPVAMTSVIPTATMPSSEYCRASESRFAESRNPGCVAAKYPVSPRNMTYVPSRNAASR